MKILIEKGALIDLIDDNNWGEYECSYSLDGGATWSEGSVQGDNNTIAVETLCDENGNAVE